MWEGEFINENIDLHQKQYSPEEANHFEEKKNSTLEQFKVDSLESINKEIEKLVSNSKNIDTTVFESSHLPIIAQEFNKLSEVASKKNLEKIEFEEKIKKESLKWGFENAVDQMLYDMQKGVVMNNEHKGKL